MLQRLARRATLGVLLLPFLLPAAAAAQTGVVSGVVVDATTRAPLAGAGVSVEGTALGTASDRSGRFTLAGVPVGSRTIVVRYLGHADERSTVDVSADRAVTMEARLARSSFTETVTVTAAPVGEGQAQALNQQRTAPNIVNVVSADQIGRFPDANAAEATQRIPGVAIERDQGEGRYVMVRGTEARLSSMMINGERIPSPEGDIRNVALDVIPIDLLQAIEVSKAITPDMDADAIGGAVNLVTKAAPARPQAFGTLAGGYNGLMEDWGQSMFSGTTGRRFADGRIGLILTGSASRVNRGSDNFEAEYDDGALDAFETRDYTVRRERYGANGALDHRYGPGSSWTLRGIYNRFADQEYRRTTGYAVGDEEIAWEMKDRLETQVIASASATANHLFGNGALLDVRASTAYAEEKEPESFYTTFLQEDVAFAPNVRPDFIDPGNVQPNPLNRDVNAARFDEQSIERSLTSDRDVVGAVNLLVPFGGTTSFAGSLKAGAKYRHKKKDRDVTVTAFESGGDILMSALLDPAFDPKNFFRGRYAASPFFGATAARALNGRPDFEPEVDPEEELADYRATERVAGAYVMANLAVGPRLTLLPGVRVESTSLDYRGLELTFGDDGDFAGARDVTGTDRYTQVLPGFHARYALAPESNLRVALTRSLARPNYYDLVPYQLLLHEDREIERGNPALHPSTSWNVDVLVERYFRSVGVVSGGLFRKSMSDFIFPFRFEEDREGAVYDVLQPRNGPTASVSGVELAFQNQLRFLPAPLDGLGLYANYTFTDSSAVIPDRPGVESRLPGQIRHSGNLSVWYEKAGFSARASLNFRGAFLSEVGGDPEEDVFVDRQHQLDVSFSHAVTPRVRLFADVLNLTNQPLRAYEGVRSRPIQEEYYRWWGSFGLRLGF